MSDIVSNGAGAAAGLPADYLAKLSKGISKSRAVNQLHRGGNDLLRMAKDGQWIFGQGNEEYQPGARIVINPASLSQGWVLWSGGVKKGEVMVPMTADMPEMPPPIDGLSFDIQQGFSAKVLDGEDIGTELTYKTASKGGRGAVDDLLVAIQAKIDEDPSHPCPAVVLENSHYPHPQYGKTYVPIFKIVGWATLDGVLEGDAPSVTSPPPAVAKPKKASLAAPAEASAPETMEPASTTKAHTGQRKRPL